MLIDSGTSPKQNEDVRPKQTKQEQDESDEEKLPITEEDRLNALMKKAKEEAIQEME